MEPESLTVQILREIRDEVRGTNARLDQTNARLDQTNARLDRVEVGLGTLREEMLARFEVVETTLRDLAQQLVVLARAVKGWMDKRGQGDDRLDALEQRVDVIEKKLGS